MVVVGAGIAGLTAARDLSEAGYDVVVLEGSPLAGGKLRRQTVAGVSVDVGAEAMLNRRPEGVELARSLGLDVVHPTTAASRIWTRGALRPLPRTLMGAPLDLDQLAASGILSAEGLLRARHEYAGRVERDVSVGDLVAQHFGDEVVERLVEPLLGGVYAGHARAISARAAVPQLVAMAERGILEQGGALPVSDDPVFAGLAGGMATLGERLAVDLDVRTGVMVRELRRSPDGFETVARATSSTNEDIERCHAVVLATPAAPTARLLADLAPTAATELAGIEHASTAVVTLAIRATDAPELAATTASGFLVPPIDGRAIKAATFSFAKWAWVREAGRVGADDLLLLRTSLGRHGEERTLQSTDDELVIDSLADLAAATGLTATPVDTHVQRWGGGFPQYAVGHLDRVDRIRSAVTQVPGLAVCGAAYDGVGIPACIASGHLAATRVAAGLTQR